MRRPAFSLIEMIVVVLILAILAAVVGPRFLNVKQDAVENGVRYSLAAVREAIDLYAVKNNGKFPGKDGNEATFKSDLRPYLKGTFPACPVGAKNSSVKISTTAGGLGIVGEAAPTKGWHYHNKKGYFIINFTGPATNGTPYDKF